MTYYNQLIGQKITSAQGITALYKHIARLSNPAFNVDPNKSANNRILLNRFSLKGSKTSELREAIYDYYDRLGIKLRINNVLMYEFVLSASHDFFNEDNLDIWIERQLDFLTDQFKSNLAYVEVHLDEKTPHIHALLTVEQYKDRLYRNRYSECVKKCYALNANMFNRKKLIELHDLHYEYNKDLGLVRGKRGGRGKSLTKKEYIDGLERMKAKLEVANEFVKQYKELRETMNNNKKFKL